MPKTFTCNLPLPVVRLATAGEKAYHAYATAVGGITFRGGLMPSWISLSDTAREAWERAARGGDGDVITVAGDTQAYVVRAASRGR